MTQHILGQPAMITRKDMESHVEHEIKSVKENLTTKHESIKTLTVAMLSLTSLMIAGLVGGQFYIGTRIGAVESRIQSLDEKIEASQHATNERFEKLTERLEASQHATNERFEKLTERLEASQHATNERLDRTNDRLDKLIDALIQKKK